MADQFGRLMKTSEHTKRKLCNCSVESTSGMLRLVQGTQVSQSFSPTDMGSNEAQFQVIDAMNV